MCVRVYVINDRIRILILRTNLVLDHETICVMKFLPKSLILVAYVLQYFMIEK